MWGAFLEWQWWTFSLIQRKRDISMSHGESWEEKLRSSWQPHCLPPSEAWLDEQKVVRETPESTCHTFPSYLLSLKVKGTFYPTQTKNIFCRLQISVFIFSHIVLSKRLRQTLKTHLFITLHPVVLKWPGRCPKSLHCSTSEIASLLIFYEHRD